MIYLDYSATTKTSDEVLDTFIKCSKDYFKCRFSNKKIIKFK